jgi:hypothetical protein
MAYSILYVEDLDPSSIVHDLQRNGFDVRHHSPEDFEKTLVVTKSFDLLLLDFRLTAKKAVFDAPTIAQTLRTLNSNAHQDIPIVLISSEEKIKDYYRDFTSQDLFDISLTKSDLLNNLEKYAQRFKSIVDAYKLIKNTKFNVDKVLSVPDEIQLDYRITQKLNSDIRSNDVYAFSNFVLNQIVTSIGVLIGEDVLSSRLGVSKKSKDWESLKDLLDFARYRGVFSSSYNRWWADQVLYWWKELTNSELSLRRMNADQRTKIISKETGLNLTALSKTKFANSSNFWTICKETYLPIDPIDGLELEIRQQLPWQEKEYLSIQAAIEPNKFDAHSNAFYLKHLKPSEAKRLSEIRRNH